MADPTIKTVFAANGTEAEKVIAGLERRMESLEQKTKRVGDTSRRAGRQFSDSFQRGPIDNVTAGLTAMAGKMAAIVSLGTAAKMVFSGMSQKIVEFNKEVGQAQERMQQEELKLQIQGGFTPQEVAAQIPAVKTALRATPAVNPAEAIQLQTQLSGAGFKAADIKSGAALKTMLDLRAVTTSFGRGMEDPKQSVLGMSQLLKGLGNINPEAKDIYRVGSKVASLMAESDIQFADLGQLAGEASTLKQFGLSENEQLGAFSWLRDIKGAEEGATGLRIFTSRTATAGTDKARTEALKKIGLKPEDVAIAKGGVQFQQAIGKIQAGMAGLSEEEKNKFLVEMYGEKGQATAAAVLDPMGAQKIGQRIDMAKQAQGDFAKRLETFQGSRFAVRKRLENATEWDLRDQAEKGLTWGEVHTIQKRAEMGVMGAQDSAAGRRTAGMMNWIGGKVLGWKEAVGYSPSDAGINVDLSKIQAQQLEEAKKQNALLQEIKNKNPPINRNAQGE